MASSYSLQCSLCGQVTVFNSMALCMVYLSSNDCWYSAGYGGIVSFPARPPSALVCDTLMHHLFVVIPPFFLCAGWSSRVSSTLVRARSLYPSPLRQFWLETKIELVCISRTCIACVQFSTARNKYCSFR